MWQGAPTAQVVRRSGMEEPSADAAYVAAAQRDPAAFEALYRRHLTGVYRYIYARVGSAADAEDLTASVFMDTLTSLRHYREQGRFAAWLYTIARRHVSAHRRRARRDFAMHTSPQADDIELVADAPSPRLQAIDQADHLLGAMACLTDVQREALALRFYSDLKVNEIAVIMGKGESAIKMILHRSLLQLRSAIEPAEPTESRPHAR